VSYCSQVGLQDNVMMMARHYPPCHAVRALNLLIARHTLTPFGSLSFNKAHLPSTTFHPAATSLTAPSPRPSPARGSLVRHPCLVTRHSCLVTRHSCFVACHSRRRASCHRSITRFGPAPCMASKLSPCAASCYYSCDPLITGWVAGAA
jgi:hypothetical protein